MKKLLLFFALWSGVACAVQGQQTDLVTIIADRVSALTPEQQQQAIAYAKESVAKTVDACGDDKKLLKVTLMQRVKALMKTAFVDAIEDVTSKETICITIIAISFFTVLCELYFIVTVVYDGLYLMQGLIGIIPLDYALISQCNIATKLILLMVVPTLNLFKHTIFQICLACDKAKSGKKEEAVTA
ncbi:MAG: hypothetical protein V1646_02560 [bacterium]